MTAGTENSKSGEIIAKYFDVILKRGVNAISTNVSTVGVRVRTCAHDFL